MGMKIAGTSRVQTSATRKAGARSASGAAFSLPGTGSAVTAEASTAATSSGAVTSVDALLAIQEVPNEREGQKRAVKRGQDMLDILDDIRMGLLTGSVPKSRLQELVHLVDSRRDVFTDPRLGELLDEIELRAKVELAKFNQVIS